MTALRRETKFALPHVDPHKVVAVLDLNCRRILHSGPVSQVRSLYFDDVGLGSFRENRAGRGVVGNEPARVTAADSEGQVSTG